MVTPLWRSESHAKADRPSRRLRGLLESGKIHPLPGAFDALSARILEAAGFEVLVLGGSAVSNALLGLPDAEFLSLDQLAAVCTYVTNAISIPVVVDADTGFGNAINVAHTIHVLEKSGAAGARIEDQLAPKRSGHISGKQVIPLEEMVGKVRAAVEAREDPNFVIFVRSDARATEGPDGAIRRCNAYAEAGAEVTFVDGALSREEMRRFATEIRSPFHAAGMGGSAKRRTTPKLPLDELEAMGFNLVTFGLQMIRAAARGMIDFATALRRDGIKADLALLEQVEGYPIEDWYRFTGFDRIGQLEQRYLPQDALAKYAAGPDRYYRPGSKE